MSLASAEKAGRADAFSLGYDNDSAAFCREDPSALAGIYREKINIAIWQRRLNKCTERAVKTLLGSAQTLQIVRTVAPESAEAVLSQALRMTDVTEFSRDVAELVDMFCCLFGCKTAGLRLTALHHAMCPRFHVDNVPCRLLTTYQGPTTQWLPHACVSRSKLGAGNQGKRDSESGLYRDASAIQQLCIGDVALLKGEHWEGNENAGLVHRSPGVPVGESRLLLTLDLVN